MRVRVFSSEFNNIVDTYETDIPPSEGDVVKVNDTDYTVIKRTWGKSPLFYESFVDILANPGSKI